VELILAERGQRLGCGLFRNISGNILLDRFLERCGLAAEWNPDDARAWWVAKGRGLAAARSKEATPSAFTLSRPVVERAG